VAANAIVNIQGDHLSRKPQQLGNVCDFLYRSDVVKFEEKIGNVTESLLSGKTVVNFIFGARSLIGYIN